MYKVRIEHLNEVTKFLDQVAHKNSITSEYYKKKAKKLSQKIKSNYTEIRP